jgi:hypothetical protein
MKCKNCGRDVRLRRDSDYWPVEGLPECKENPKYRHTHPPIVNCTPMTTVALHESDFVTEILKFYNQDFQ